MNRLIVTADDVGLHGGMTEGALHAHHHGIVTACSVAPCGAAFDDAVAALAAAPALDIGAHLMLVEGRPVLPPAHVPTLVRADGRFHESHRGFAARYLAGRISRRDVERELRAQLARLRAAGLRLVHVNTHQHLHLLPGVFEIVVRLAREAGIPYVRVVRDHGGGRGVLRRAALGVLNVLGRRADPGGLRTSDRTIGVFRAGHLTAASLIALLPHVEGVTELVTHPGLGNAELSRAYRWGYDWDGETAALCEPAVRRALDARGIGLERIRTFHRE